MTTPELDSTARAFLADLKGRAGRGGVLPVPLMAPFDPEEPDPPVKDGFVVPAELRGAPEDCYELVRSPSGFMPLGWRLSERGQREASSA